MSTNNANGNRNPGANTVWRESSWNETMKEYFRYRAENPTKPLQVGSYLHSWEKNQRTAIRNREEGIKSGYQITPYQYKVLLERNFQKETHELKGFRKILSFCLKCCTQFELQNKHTNYFKDDAEFLNNDGENRISLLRSAVTQVRNHKKYIGKDKRDRLVELGIELHPNACTRRRPKKRRSRVEMIAHREGSDSTSSLTGENDEDSSSSSDESDVPLQPSGGNKQSKVSDVSDVHLRRSIRKKQSNTSKPNDEGRSVRRSSKKRRSR